MHDRRPCPSIDPANRLSDRGKIPVPRLSPDDLARLLDGDEIAAPSATPAHRPPRRPADALPPKPRMRRNEAAPFRCGRCRRMVGQTVSGGRHRNHCPFCLTSRHVDLRRPGDRANPCRALMAPVGVAYRPDGEQLVVHRCNGCGELRRTRVAADDDPVALLRLPPFAATEPAPAKEGEAIA